MAETLISKRLRHEMTRQGLSSAELAKRAELKPSFIYDVLSGKSANPSTFKLARVAEVLGTNLSYLVGSINERSASLLAQLPADARQQEEDYIAIARMAGDIAETEEDESRYCCFRREWIQHTLGAAPSVLRMMTVRDDSMEPTLHHRDILLVDTSRTAPTPPGIFVLHDGVGLLVKRIELISHAGHQRLRILSDNAHYSAYERDRDEVRIAGRIVWFSRTL